MPVSDINFVGPLLNTSVPTGQFLLLIDFPTSEDGRVYHLGIRCGELVNRIVHVTGCWHSFVDPIIPPSTGLYRQLLVTLLEQSSYQRTLIKMQLTIIISLR